MEFYQCKFLIIPLILLFFIPFSHCSNPWLTTCFKDGSKYYLFEPNHYEHGIYFRKPIEPSCICARGVWVFKRDICEPRGKIGYLIAANEERSCFKWKSGNPIKYLRYLGDTFNWKAQTALVADKDFSRFEKIGGVGTKTMAGYSNIIIVNPQDDRSEIRDCGNTWCYAPEKGTFETKCHDCNIGWIASAGVVWKKVDNRTGYWFNTEETPEFCEVKNEFGLTTKIPHDRDFKRIAWGAAYVESPYGDSIAGRCTIPCDQPVIDELPPDHNGGVYIDKYGGVHPVIPTTTTTTVLPPTVSNGTATNGTAINGTETANSTETTTTPAPAANATEGNSTAAKPGGNGTGLYPFLNPDMPVPIDLDNTYPPNCTLLPNKYNPLSPKQKTEIREQTLRMMKMHYEVVLNGQRTPEVKTPEYELFQTSRLIMEKVCPQQEVPKTLLRSLLRMFRMVLNETQGDKYPYLMISDAGSIKRLQKSLLSCLNVDSKKQFNFQYSQCPREYTHINITDIAVKAQVPCELQYNTTKYDYVVESAWKTLMFVHYYCAEYFDKEQYDHSRLQFILQKFFNRNIMHRWFQQGKSSEIFEFMFSTYDLKAFKDGMDHCVAGARSVSPYKKWIKRPAYENDCAGEIEEGEGKKRAAAHPRKAGLGKHNLILDGQGVMMTHYDDMLYYKLANAQCFPTLEEPICYEYRDEKTIPPPEVLKPDNKHPRYDGQGDLYTAVGQHGPSYRLYFTNCYTGEPCCQNLKVHDDAAQSVDMHFGCITFYDDKDCNGDSISFSAKDPLEKQRDLKEWNLRISSAKPCEAPSGLYVRPKIPREPPYNNEDYEYVDLYDQPNLQGNVIRIDFWACWNEDCCQNLEEFENNTRSLVVTRSNCIAIFKTPDCSGETKLFSKLDGPINLEEEWTTSIRSATACTSSQESKGA